MWSLTNPCRTHIEPSGHQDYREAHIYSTYIRNNSPFVNRSSQSVQVMVSIHCNTECSCLLVQIMRENETVPSVTDASVTEGQNR